MRSFWILVIILVSCSKPVQQEAIQGDSIQTPKSPGARIDLDIFLFIRGQLLGNDIAYREEFFINEEDFNYTLLRYKTNIDTIHIIGNYTTSANSNLLQVVLHTKDIRDTTFNIDLQKPFRPKLGDLYVIAKIRELTDDDLRGLGRAELSLVRNDIYARHGHIFKTPQMVSYYKAMDWYRPIIEDASPLLNGLENRNVEFIKQKEEQ